MAKIRKPRPEPFERAIARLNTESVAAFNRCDIAACAGFYEEDATMLLPDRPPLRGRAAIVDCLRGFAAAGMTLMPVTPVTVVAGTDFGCCAGLYSFATRGSGKGMQAGKFVTVLRRQRDGTWKAAIDAFFADSAAA